MGFGQKPAPNEDDSLADDRTLEDTTKLARRDARRKTWDDDDLGNLIAEADRSSVDMAPVGQKMVPDDE